MLPNVKILLLNGQLGGVARYADGVAGLMGTGVAVAGKIQIGDPRLIVSLDEAIALGLDATNNPVAYRHIKEFYDEAGTGAELYVMIVSDTMNQTTMNDITTANGINKLLSYANGRIRVYGTFFNPPVSYIPTLTNGLDGDVFTAVAKAQATCGAYATNQTPCRSIIEGRAFTGVAANLTDLLTMTNNRVAVMIGGSLNDGSASVGLALGRIAKIPVQRKISRVKDGSIALASAYVGNTTIEASTQLGLMHDKGYIVIRQFPGLSGYYFSDDVMATKATDDYRFMARGRIADKASVIAYATFVEELHDEIIVLDGKLDAGQVKYLEKKIEGQINTVMTANREISGVDCTIDVNQNILATNKTVVKLKLSAVGYNSDIEVQLGF